MNVTTPAMSSPLCLTTPIPANISADDFNVSYCDTSGEYDDSESDDGIVVFFSYGQRVVYAFILCVIAIIGFVGNVMVVAACAMVKKLRTKTNSFVVNLSIADLLTSINLPFYALGILSVHGWPLANGFCIYTAASLMMCTMASLYSMAGTAVCRCALIVLPHSKYQVYLSDFRTGILIAVSWLIPIACTTFPIFIVPDFLQFNERYSACSWNTDHWFNSIYNFVLFVSMFPIPLTTIAVAYFKIWKHVRDHSKKLQAAASTSTGGSSTTNNSRQKAAVSKRQMQLTINLLIVVAAFLACISPYTIFLILPASVGNYWLVPPLSILLQSNVCINPLVYGTRHPDFKAAFRNMFRCMRPPEVAPERTEHSAGESKN
ncbi:histamine H2 receptor-like [Amphiura filiformis]|uniref:histamine H2 receptor-like n=1 Tax=Amphiura filiformis TaxID=82378 RepID=UPI003B2124DA